MDTSLTNATSITVKASLEKIWQVLTDPAYIKQYLFGTEAVSDWKEGGELIFQGEWEGKPYRDKGTILKTVPLEVFQYTYWSGFSGLEDVPENYSVVTYLLTDNGDTRTLTIQQAGFIDEAARLHTEQNWIMVLEQIKGILETAD